MQGLSGPIRSTLVLAAWVALSFAAAITGVAWPPGEWYAQLAKPAWTPAFFGLHRPGLAFAIIAALWLAIAATIRAFLRHDRAAALLLLPYLVWVSYAAALNLALWRMN
jgi:benzodiazapine receptor